MQKLKNWLAKQVSWLKKNEFNLFNFLLLFYIFFIPLWPKLPIKTIEYTYIAIRWEDLFMAIMVFVFFIHLLTRKFSLKGNPLTIILVGYWIVVFVAYLLGFYVFKTVKTLELGFLHAARRIEYMIVVIMAYAALKNKEQFWFYLRALVLVFFIVCVYGIGQKFLGWPAVQTMNPHYSKGYLLVLDATARISSTFGGHYDFSSYITLFIPITLGLYFYEKKRRYFLTYVISLFALVLTASRTSFIAYLVSIIPFALCIEGTKKTKFKYLAIFIILIVLLAPLSNNLTQRIKRTFRQTQIWYNPWTGNTVLPRNMSSQDVPPGDFLLTGKIPTPIPGQKVPVIGKKTDAQVKKELNVTDEDIYKIKQQIRQQINEEAKKSNKKIDPKEVEKAVDEAFSQLKPIQTVVPDISISTRLQVEWPRAIKAFLQNPLTGLGPASITEATDNDYLRSLGETGILGFILLFGIIARALWLIWQKIRLHQTSENIVFWGIIWGSWSLLVTALYFDIFEASKIALIVWFTWGITLKYIKLEKVKTIKR